MTGSVLCVLFFSTMITLCELTDPRNCTVKANLPCWMYTIDDQCSPAELQSQFPDIYITTENNPGRVFHFNATIYYDVYEGNNKTYPGVNLIFTPPVDGSITLVRGFQITRSKSDKPGSVTCYIFNMSGAVWSPESDKDVVFSFPIFPIKPGVTYGYNLHTLPKPDPLFDQSKFVSLVAPDYKDSMSPGKWSTVINYDVLHENRVILTEFVLPPEEYGFRYFNISLWNPEEKKFFVFNKRVSGATNYFRNVTPGIYQIWVQPVDPYLFNPFKCLCKTPSDGCDTCTTSATPNFTVLNITSSTVATSSSTPSTTAAAELPSKLPLEDTSETAISTGKIVGAVFGCLGGILLVAVLVVFYRLRCRPEEYDMKAEDLNHNLNGGFDPEVASVVTLEFLKKGGNLEKHNNANANKIRFEKRKKMFLLYEEDHQYHRLVVDKFATYLSLHCQCDVEQAELQHDAPWVHQDLAQADFVIIVNSEAAYKANMSCNSQKTSSKNPSVSSINSIRNRFMRDERYDHIIMVYFSYTDERFILPDICTGYKYKLMKHFTDFLLHVHNLRRTDNLSNFDLPFDGNHILRPIGQQLLDSIDQATKFEAENPNWYIQAHGMTRGISNISQESQLLSGDSGCPDDFTPGQTPIMGPTDPWSNINSIKPIDTNSVVTVTQSDLNADGQYPKFIPKNSSKQRPLLRLPHESFVKPSIQEETQVFTPPTDSPSDFEIDFIAPDLNSNLDAMSHTQSRQLEVIVDQYTKTLKDLGGWKSSPKSQREASEGQGHYDKETDLAILDAHSREVMFNSAMEGETISLGSVGGVSM